MVYKSHSEITSQNFEFDWNQIRTISERMRWWEPSVAFLCCLLIPPIFAVTSKRSERGNEINDNYCALFIKPTLLLNYLSVD